MQRTINLIRNTSIRRPSPLPHRLFSTTTSRTSSSVVGGEDGGHKPLCMQSETEQMTREMVQQFAKQHLARDRVRRMDKEAMMDDDLVEECFASGLMGIEIPEEYDGSGLSFMNAIIAIEELARVDPSLSVLVDVHNTLVNRIVTKFGTEEIRKRWLPKLATDTVGSFCLSETSSGSDAFALKARAKDMGDHWLINGEKSWITNADRAGVFLVMATVDPSLGYKGITAFVVDGKNPGIRVSKKEEKLGLCASGTCVVSLEDCKVPKEDVVGEIGKGYKIAIDTLNEGRIGIGSQMVGLAQGAYDHALPYMQQRVQFGKPIADFQAMQVQYAKAATEIQAARLLVYEAARMRDAGLPFQKEAAMAKYYASEIAVDVSTKCIEWLGGVGFTKEFMAEKYYRDSIVGRIYEGTSIMNLVTISKFIQDHYRNTKE